LADPAPFTVESFQASDGYRLQYRRYVNASANQQARTLAHVVCLHGIQSHAGWYEYSCRKLSQAGFIVSFLDRRGSGMNKEARGDTPSFRRLLQDVAEFLEYLSGQAKAGSSNLPIFVIGISWGGKVAVPLSRFRLNHVSGMVLICPGLCPRVHAPFSERLRIVWARLVSPRRLFSIPLNDPEMFTATPRWLDFLRGDALSLHRATARFLVESVRLDRYLKRVPPYVRVPVLLLLAEKDRIIDNAATRHYVAQFATSDQRVIEYAGAHHTLEFDPDSDRFIADVRAWLEQHALKQIAGS
jgi:alpha-beta hydrolase superfamily lysophospholipase